MSSAVHNARDFSVFDLHGERMIFYNDNGRGIWSHERFTLNEGLMLIRTDHDGNGLFKVVLSKVEPGFFDNDDVLFQYEGRYADETAYVVIEGDWRAPRPHVPYELEVECTGNYTIEIFQPELGQSNITLPYRLAAQDAGTYLVGPVQVSARPTLAMAKHNARGMFYVQILPVDGSHEEENFIETSGQAILEDQPTNMRPGKEYIIEIGASGKWELELYEGY